MPRYLSFALALVVLTAALYDFVQLDDPQQVTENPIVLGGLSTLFGLLALLAYLRRTMDSYLEAWSPACS